MSDNPYQSPEGAARVVGGRPFQIAVAQKNVLYVLLAQILFNVMAIPALLSSPDSQTIVLIIRIVGIGLGIASLVVLYKLASTIYGRAIGIVCAVLGLFPCLGLLTLLAVNGVATNELRKAGYKVGLMGANLSQFQ